MCFFDFREIILLHTVTQNVVDDELRADERNHSLFMPIVDALLANSDCVHSP